MIHLLGPLASAAAAAPPSSTLDTLLAPAGGTAAVVGLLVFVAREYRSARRENVAAAKAREAQADKERAEADAANEALRTRLEALERKVEELNGTIRQMDAKHTDEVRALRETHTRELERERNRTVQAVAVGWRLREILAENGIPVPPDLSAKRRDVTPLLDLAHPSGDDLDDDGADGAV